MIKKLLTAFVVGTLMLLVAAQAWAATAEVSQPVQVTTNSYYERGQSIVYDGADYWLVYGRSASETGNYQAGTPDINDYEVYYKKASTVPGLVGATPAAISGATNSYMGETGAAYYGGEVWAFSTIDVGTTAEVYGWYTTDGSSWTQVSSMVTGLSDGAAHHDEVAYNGELFVMVRRGDDFYTTHSSTPKTGGWSTEVAVGSAGGLAHFFLDGGTLYLAVLKSPAPRMNQIFQYNSGTDSWSLVDEAASDGWDPTLLKVGSYYVFVQAPWTGDGGGRQYNIAWAGTSLSTLLSGGTSVAVTEGKYGSNTWVDMWPIGFTDNGGTSYLFFTSERNPSDPHNEGTGNIWYLEYDWDVTSDHFTYIQEAVDAAAASDVINVAAGTYEEQVVVTTGGLTLDGAGSGADPASNTIIKSPVSLTYSFDSGSINYPIVGFDGVTGVTIEDCRIDGAGRGNANSRFCGIAFWNAGGDVSACYLTGVRDTPFSGAQHGVAVYAYNNTGGPYTLGVTDTNVDDFQKTAMALNGNGLSVAVDGCDITGQGHTGVTAQNGIQIGFGAGGSVIDCSVSDIGWTGGTWTASGILFYEGSTVNISGSTAVSNCQASVLCQETQSTITDITVTSGDIDDAEGISIRDYGYAMLSGEMIQPAEVSPFEETWAPDLVILGGAATSVTVTGAQLTGQHHGGDYGIAVWAMGDPVIASVTDCEIDDYEIGIVAYEDVSTVMVTANSNSIYSNDAGLWTNAAAAQDVESNYWGDASGPYNATTNPDGTGNEVDGNADYSAWWGGDYVGDPHTSPWTWYTNDNIQAAISWASAGDIVYVHTGTYAENVFIGKALTLCAASTPEIAPATGVGVDIAASDVTVQGFDIHGCDTGIQVYLPPAEYNVSFGYTDLKLLDNTIYDISDGAWGFGMYLGTESERYNPADPIGIYDPSLTDLLDFSGLEIKGNEIYSTTGACLTLQSMRAHTGGPLEVSGNNIHDGAASGIWIDGAWDFDVTGNQLTGNSNGIFFSNYGDGYYEFMPDNAFDPKNIRVANNLVHSNVSAGFNLYDGYPGLIDFEFNSIVGNATGLDNHLSVATDGTMNWWGDASGPSGSGPGSGDPVSPFAFYDPWIGALGGENIVCVPDPEELTTSSPVKTVAVDYLGGGGGLMYGYSVKFSWDGTKVSTDPSKVTQGSLLSDQGTTTFFKMTSGTNEITVDCALLGAQPGVTGPGTMFTVEFTGLACGLSDIDITINKIRDKDNAPLSGFYEDDGELIVDMADPVFTVNGPFPDGQCYKVTPVLDLGASDACGDLHTAYYKIGTGGTWTMDADLFTDYSGSVWSNAAWTLPGFAGLGEGAHTVYFYCTDDVGNTSAEASWDFIKDTIAPPAVTGFDAAPGNQKVHLSWTNPGSDFDHVVVVRKPWAAGAYPEYVQPPADGYPVDPSDGTVVYSGTGTSYDDGVVDRNIYFYHAFAYDCAGNYTGGTVPGGSIPPGFAQGDRATNYWLGDITDGLGFTGTYDGLVNFDDISALSAAYWLYSPTSPPAARHNECDVGPTDDYSRLGLPVPDDYVDFEDLMIFAMNYGVVTALGAPVLEREEIGPVALRLEPAGSSTDELIVSLVLGGNVAEVKGVSIVLEYDAQSLELKSASPSRALSTGHVFFNSAKTTPGEAWLDLAVLGTGQAMRGSGEVAQLVFTVKGSNTEIAFARTDIRGTDNRPVDVVSESYEPEVVPAMTRLLGARPNPFTPGTTLHYELGRSEHVAVEIYDTRGRLVRQLVDGVLDAGSYSEMWDGMDSQGNAVHGGIYFVKMRAGSYESTTKLVKVN